MNQEQKKIETLEAEVIRLRYSNVKLVEEKEEAEGKAQRLFMKAFPELRKHYDQQVAARVLRDLCDGVLFFSEARHDLRDIADRYERGEKEVPDEL